MRIALLLAGLVGIAAAPAFGQVGDPPEIDIEQRLTLSTSHSDIVERALAPSPTVEVTPKAAPIDAKNTDASIQNEKNSSGLGKNNELVEKTGNSPDRGRSTDVSKRDHADTNVRSGAAGSN